MLRRRLTASEVGASLLREASGDWPYPAIMRFFRFHWHLLPQNAPYVAVFIANNASNTPLKVFLCQIR